MYLAHLLWGFQPYDGDATSWFTQRLMAVEKGPRKSNDSSRSTRPAINRHQLCQLFRFSPLRAEISVGVQSEGGPTGSGLPQGGTSDGITSEFAICAGFGQQSPRAKAPPQKAWGFRSDPHARYDPHGGDMRIPQNTFSFCSTRPSVRVHVRIGNLIFPFIRVSHLFRSLRSLGAHFG